jgi:hypothetical protein
MEEALLTHELTHALQDRRLELDKRMKGLRDCSDGLLALEAFLEGEATVVMAESLLARLPDEVKPALSDDTLEQLTSGLASAGTAGVEGSDGVPEFFVKELLFPYTSGTSVIQATRGKKAGWTGIDEAYLHLPGTTSEILHPGKSFAGRLRLSADSMPGTRDIPEKARLIYYDTLGEWILRTLLERAGDGEASANAAAWQDDRIVFFEQGHGDSPQIGFLWRVRCLSAGTAARVAAVLEPLYAARPAPARPTIRVSGDIVEVARSRTAITSPKGP